MTTRARTTATVRAVGDGRADGYGDDDDNEDENDVGDGDYYDEGYDDDNGDEARFLGQTQRRSSTIPSTSTADEPWYVTRRRERGRRRRARDDASSRRCGGAALATCAVLFVIGFSATGRSKYDDRLNMQITAYEGVVREWSSRGRDTFQGGGARTFELSATKAGASATWVSSAPVTTTTSSFACNARTRCRCGCRCGCWRCDIDGNAAAAVGVIAVVVVVVRAPNACAVRHYAALHHSAHSVVCAGAPRATRPSRARARAGRCGYPVRALAGVFGVRRGRERARARGAVASSSVLCVFIIGGARHVRGRVHAMARESEARGENAR